MPGDSEVELRNVGDYRILRRLGEGGMGSVYLGYQEDSGRQVAVMDAKKPSPFSHVALVTPIIRAFWAPSTSPRPIG